MFIGHSKSPNINITSKPRQQVRSKSVRLWLRLEKSYSRPSVTCKKNLGQVSGESSGIAFNKLLQMFHSVTSLSPVGWRQSLHYRLDLAINGGGGVIHASQRLLLSSRRSRGVRRCRNRWKAAVSISELKNKTIRETFGKSLNMRMDSTKNPWQEQRSIWKTNKQTQNYESYFKCKTD